MTVTKNNIVGSEFWVNSGALPLRDILIESRVPSKWSTFSTIEKYWHDSLIKPINRYVSNLYPKPKIMSVLDNTITLRQFTHAEIWVEPKVDDDLYALDKCWQRQFYPSDNFFDDLSCFSPTYRFYMPWIPDYDGEIKVVNCKVNESVFIIRDSMVNLTKKNINSDFIDVPFIDFKIKKDGPHMKTEEYGIIDIGTPMYDMVLTLSDEEIDNVRRFFG